MPASRSLLLRSFSVAALVLTSWLVWKYFPRSAPAPEIPTAVAAISTPPAPEPGDAPSASDPLAACRTLADFSALLARLGPKAPVEAELVARLLKASRARLTPGEHSELMGHACKLLAADPAAGAAVVRSLESLHDQQALANGTTLAIATTDPAAAAKFAMSLEGHDMARTAVETAARTWAEKDRPATMDWINGITHPVLQGLAAEGLAQTWATADFDGLTTWATGIEDPYVQTGVLTKAAKIRSSQNPGVAADWASKFPAGMARRQALTYAAGNWAKTQPEAAAAWAVRRLTDPEALKEAATGIMTAWAPRDEAKALAWAATLPGSLADEMAVLANARPRSDTLPPQPAN